MSYPLSGAGRPGDHSEVVAWTAPDTAQDVPCYGHVRQYLSVDRISAVRGHFDHVQAVLYRRRLTDTADPGTVPDFIALGQDASGQHVLVSGAGCNGWIHDGRLIPLTPVNGQAADQAW